jgi:hypothetical protein
MDALGKHSFCTGRGHWTDRVAALTRRSGALMVNSQTLRSSLLALAGAFVVCAAAACAPRQVEVRTAPSATTNVALQVTNTLQQAVNVYVTAGGQDTFLRQVPANSTQIVPVQGLPVGTTVTVKAVTIDGTSTYKKDNVVLNGTYIFHLP